MLGAVAIVFLGSMALGSGGKPDKLIVAKEVTTTTGVSSSTTEAPLITAPTSTATSTTAAATSTTVTLPIASTSTSEATTTTSKPEPAHFLVTFDRDLARDPERNEHDNLLHGHERRRPQR